MSEFMALPNPEDRHRRLQTPARISSDDEILASVRIGENQ
jgi:hypothetical protein